MKARFITCEERNSVTGLVLKYVTNDPQAIEQRIVKEHEVEIAGCFSQDGEPFFVVAMPDGTFSSVPVRECRHDMTCDDISAPIRHLDEIDRLEEIIRANTHGCGDCRGAAEALLNGGMVTLDVALTFLKIYGQQKSSKDVLIKALQDGEIDGIAPQMREVKYRKRYNSNEYGVRLAPSGHYSFNVSSLVVWLSSRYRLQATHPILVGAIESVKNITQ